VHAQRELAVQMARYSLRRFGLNSVEAEAVAQGLRGRALAAVAPAAPSRLSRLRGRTAGLAARVTGTSDPPD
jgi:hypothetical protein